MKKMVVIGFLFLFLFSSCVGYAEEKENAKLDLSTVSYAQVNLKGGTLKFREKPNGKVMSNIPAKKTVCVLEHDEDWSKITYKGKTGYVKTSFLMKKNIPEFKTLKIEDYGPPVQRLKKRMQELGYFRSGPKMTGDFTITTERRLKLLQAKLGLEEDGIATPELQAYIFYGGMKKNTQPLPPAPFKIVYNDTFSETNEIYYDDPKGRGLYLAAYLREVGDVSTDENGKEWITESFFMYEGWSNVVCAPKVHYDFMTPDGFTAIGSYKPIIDFKHPLTTNDIGYIRMSVWFPDKNGYVPEGAPPEVQLIVTVKITSL